MWATPVSDITPVAHLTNLNDFRASYCEITDISPLANLVKLEKLSLPGNGIHGHYVPCQFNATQTSQP